MDDLISRAAAITAIQKAYADTEGGEDKYAVWKNVGLTNALHIMQDLPTAQPTLTCDGCRHVGTYDTEFPCNGCLRREKDYYEQEQ